MLSTSYKFINILMEVMDIGSETLFSCSVRDAIFWILCFDLG